jgi:hypothetical protein
MWALHNSLKSWTLYGLNEREVQLFLNSMTANEIKLLSICNLTDKVWQSFDTKKYPQFLSDTGKNRNHFPEPVVSLNHDTEAEYFIVKPKKVILPRLHERIEIEIDVMIEGHNQQFKSKTVDLSEGGIYFKSLIPDWVSGYFIVVVSYNGQSQQIMCSLVEDQKVKHRVQVMSEDSDQHFINYKRFLDGIRSHGSNN